MQNAFTKNTLDKLFCKVYNTANSIIPKDKYMTENEITDLLHQWEESYKKGLLSFWILFSLTQRPMYAYEMKTEIIKFSQDSISADDNSIYRALKRFTKTGLIEGKLYPSPSGPARKYFSLTAVGTELLRKFIERNILIFKSEEFSTTIQSFLDINK
ncbi:MAG: PadR family transcriptional regulator [Chloroflexi bacterium]|nr:PadR family transcriptional regulator [Chloroflexota bacterium]